MKRNVARKHARPFARRLSSFAGDLRGARMVVLDANMSGGVLAIRWAKLLCRSGMATIPYMPLTWRGIRPKLRFRP